MTSYIFQNLANKGKAEGMTSTSVKDAREWFREAALEIKNVNRQKMMSDRSNLKQEINDKSIGKMFAFFYDPKLKESLPYYDMFPLVFIIDFKPEGFMGLNLHYLPPVLRAKLMDALYQTINNTKYDQSTKLKVSYRILNSASKFRWFKPCLKYYLFSHVKGNYLSIEPNNWDAALMLPTEQFRKANKETVWKESREIV
jgi:hypothetical protein